MTAPAGSALICVALLRHMVDDGWFVGHEDTTGMEIELDLVEPLGRPRLVNDAVLEHLCRADMQHGLGQFNDQSRARIEGLGVRMVAVGTLRTLGAATRPHRRCLADRDGAPVHEWLLP